MAHRQGPAVRFLALWCYMPPLQFVKKVIWTTSFPASDPCLWAANHPSVSHGRGKSVLMLEWWPVGRFGVRQRGIFPASALEVLVLPTVQSPRAGSWSKPWPAFSLGVLKADFSSLPAECWLAWAVAHGFLGWTWCRAGSILMGMEGICFLEASSLALTSDSAFSKRSFILQSIFSTYHVYRKLPQRCKSLYHSFSSFYGVLRSLCTHNYAIRPNSS